MSLGEDAVKEKKYFPIVGIGGSAGGLEAFEDLLKNISNKPGMAIIFIMHLSPGHKSLLTELLARKTNMPVSEITNGMTPQIDHVYVKPANANLVLKNGRLVLSALNDTDAKRMPIDTFFHSLAEELGNRSVGVIMSGTATDGTLGAEAIKAGGGITFAQDGESAKYNDMPQSAIAAGCVDFVLSPKKIAVELERISRHPFISSLAPIKTDDAIIAKDKSFETIFDILRRSTGLDFTYYKAPTISRRISRRIVVTKQGNLKNYVKFLRGDNNEVASLYEDLLINVTSFFRDKKVFQALERSVIPAILKSKKKDESVRVWVPGCSSGEEAYSIAILFAEALGRRTGTFPIQIFATDVSNVGIDKARRGVYGQAIKNDISPARLKRFFIKEGSQYRISKSLREMCVFSKQNVFSDPPFSSIDLISCRNLLIYIQPILQKKIFHNFHYSLRPGSFLVLGNSESAAGYSNLFKDLDRKHKIFTKKYVPIRLEPESVQEYYPLKKSEAQGKIAIKTEKGADVNFLVDSILLNEYAPCGVLIDGNMEVVQFRGHTGRFLESAAGKPNLSIFKLAREGLIMPLRSAIHKAKKTRRAVKIEADNISYNGRKRSVVINAIPVRSANLKEELFLVLFDEIGRAGAPGGLPGKCGKISAKRRSVEKDSYIKNLERELTETKEYLQTVIEEQENVNEEVKTANEEILSSNEELQSTNEELETAKEELQSSNEELTTTNEELQNRNVEVSILNNDLINLLNSINVPIVMMSSDLVIRRVTPQADKVLNVTSSDVGRPISKVKLNIDIPDLEKILYDVMESLSPKTFEIKDNKGEWFSVCIRPYRTIDNKIDGVVMVFIDNTVPKKAGILVSELLNEQRIILDSVPAMIFYKDKENRFIRVNQAFAEVMGIPKEKLEGKSCSDIYPKEQAQAYWMDDKEVIKSGKPKMGIEEAMLTDKGIVLLETDKIPYKDVKGNTIGIIGFAIDVTEHKQAEEALIALEDNYHTIFESANDAIIIRDIKTYKIIDANKKACEIFCYSKEEMKKLSLGSLSANSFHYPVEKLKSFYDKASNGEPQFFEWPAKDKFGREFWVEINVKRALIGGQYRLLYIARDITERKQLLEQKEKFMNMVSHELRTPLGVIKESIALVYDGKVGSMDKEEKEILDVGKKNVDRLTRLINDVLDLEKMDSGMMKLKLDENDINKSIKEVHKAMASLAAKKGIRFVIELDNNLPRVKFDKDKILQVLINLIGNAIKFTEEGNVTITSTQGNNFIRVSVEDTGPGIKEEDLPKLFQRFSQLKRKPGGTGLGLAICREIIDMHKGKVEAESESGKGATFYFTLPILDGRV